MKKIMFLLLLFCMAQRSAAETNDVAARVSEGRQLYLGGAFTKAIQAYADAWASGKATTDEAGYSVANEAGTELARMYSRLGRMDQLEPLLRELSTRRFFGAAARRLEDATGALWSMRHEPGTSFLCGPYALANVLQTFQGSEKAMPKAIADARSNSRGFSMDEVWKLSKQVGAHLQMAKRQPGAVVLVPSVVHWKVGHYAALVEEKAGIYLSKDPTFVEQIQLTVATLDEEASGYFLVREGALPQGWSAVLDKEAKAIHGKGLATSKDDPPPPCNGTFSGSCPVFCSQGNGGSGGGSCDLGGMPQYNFDVAQPALVLVDMPLHSKVPRGPNTDIVIRYHSRTANPVYADDVTGTSFGVNWSFAWNAYMQLDTNPAIGSYLEAPGGGREPLSSPYSLAKYFPGAPVDACIRGGGLAPSTVNSSYTRELPSGWKEVYGHMTSVYCSPRPAPLVNCGPFVCSPLPCGQNICAGIPPPDFTRWRLYLTQLIDPQGNAVTLEYGGYSGNLVAALIDANGQRTTFTYGLGDNHVTSVTDSFGRHADFEYTGSAGNRLLVAVIDQIGLRSTFKYEHPTLGDFVTSMTTPYGTTKFSFKAANLAITGDAPCGYNGGQIVGRCLDVLDPVGNREFVSDSGHRNIYHWGKKAMQVAPQDTGSGILYNFDFSGPGRQSNFPYQVKVPGRPAMEYKFKPLAGTPNGMLRVVAMGPNSGIGNYIYLPFQTSFDYNAYGLVISRTDPLNRSFTYIYAPNQQDLLEIRDNEQKTLASFTHNASHRPLTSVDAAGQVTRYGYNGFGQLKSVQRPVGDTVTLDYDALGQLIAITPPDRGSKVTFGYDDKHRIQSSTDVANGTLAYTYDEMDRLRRIDYPDATFETMEFDKLDLISQRDRLGRTTSLTHDAMRRITSVTDPLNRITGFGWCGCGALDTLTDPSGHTTTWNYDVVGRLLKKIYADGTGIDYQYDWLGRLGTVTDAKNQVKTYSYFNDDQLQSVTYALLPGSPATPNVSFGYDSVLGRLNLMTDGTGTTQFSYYPIATGTLGAGRLATVDGPLLGDDIAYTYDENGRLKSTAIAGVAETYTYDPVTAQLIGTQNPLGAFSYGYDSAGRLNSANYPNGQKIAFDYFGPAANGNLKQIKHLLGNTVLAQFDYTYNAASEITQWTQNQGGATKTWDMTASDAYDPAGQLHKATLQPGNLAHQWDYDAAGNRTGESIGSMTKTFGTNNLNQLTQMSANLANLDGEVNRTVTGLSVNGAPVPTPNPANQFQNQVPLVTGSNTVSIQATAADGAVTTNRYSIQNPQALGYDANGNLTSTGSITMDYDAENRLVKVSSASPAKTSEFTYDGFDRRVGIVEKQGVSTVATRNLIWNGDEISEERNAGNSVIKRFYPDGVQVVTGSVAGNYFYQRDHLQSVRAVINSAGVSVANYDYDLWGRRSVVAGTFDADFGYGGYFNHAASGLSLAMYRAYSSATGTWLSRDPMQELAGANLYAYVGNSPLNFIDPLGLMRIEICRNKGSMTLFNDDGSVAMTASVVTGCDPANTPLGDYKMGDWQHNKTNPKFTGPNGWDKDMSNPYGPWFSRLSPTDGKKDPEIGIHGTAGPGWSPFTRLPGKGWCSHGCNRLSNPNINKLHDMLPKLNGTAVTIKDCP